MEKIRWNKKIFAMLLEKARGERSCRQFAIECGISYVQMRKLIMMTQENPPRPKLIRKIAMHAFGDIDLEDLLFAAGIILPDTVRETRKAPSEPETLDEKYRMLPPRERKTVLLFVDFLLKQSDASEEEHSSDKQ